ncbi:MAG TPA: hypothetical protein VGG16_01050 [Streptosporangiaceae bacterium]
MVVHTRPQRRDSSGAGYGQLSPTLTAALPTVYRRWGSKRELIRQALTGAAAALAAARAGVFRTQPDSAASRPAHPGREHWGDRREY